MVYFGPKNYRPERVGPSNRERFRIIGLLALLIVLVVTVWSSRVAEDPPATEISWMQPGESVEGSDSPTGEASVDSSSAEGEVPEPVSLPHPEEGPPAAPFVDDPEILAAVRDQEAVVEGPSELAGLHYLLHRWRSEWQPDEVTEPPTVPELANLATELRGRRYNFVISLIENPRLRELEENSSGLTSVWEAFGSDRSSRLHRINFIHKPKNLPRGTEVVVTGDFLRLYRYTTLSGMEGMVPEWVCGQLEPYQSPFANRSKWTQNLFWVLTGMSVITLAIGVYFYSRSFSVNGSRKKAR